MYIRAKGVRSGHSANVLKVSVSDESAHLISLCSQMAITVLSAMPYFIFPRKKTLSLAMDMIWEFHLKKISENFPLRDDFGLNDLLAAVLGTSGLKT